MREGVVVRYHNGLTEVGADQAAWVDVGATSPIPMTDAISWESGSRSESIRETGYSGAHQSHIQCNKGYRTYYQPKFPPSISVLGHRRDGTAHEHERTYMNGDGEGGHYVRRIAASRRFLRPRISILEVAGAVVNVVPGQGSETLRTEETALTVFALIESQNRTE